MMYAETEFLFPHFQDVHRSYASSMVSPWIISDYYLGGEGDLFKAAEPIIEEPILGIDPMSCTAMSMFSCAENDISSQVLNISDMDLIECDQLLSEVFYECKKDILAKEATETPISEVFDIKVDPFIEDDKYFVPKSMSTGCLSSVEELWTPNFLDFDGVAEFGTVYGMRRAYSEGDIEALGNDNYAGLVNFKLGQPQVLSSLASEDRREKLSRYWNKKSKRNFGRKIKYACRKALADSQPRIRGRFARNDECDTSTKLN